MSRNWPLPTDDLQAPIRHAFCRRLAGPNAAGSIESHEAYIASVTDHLVSKLHFIANTVGSNRYTASLRVVMCNCIVVLAAAMLAA